MPLSLVELIKVCLNETLQTYIWWFSSSRYFHTF